MRAIVTTVVTAFLVLPTADAVAGKTTPPTPTATPVAAASVTPVAAAPATAAEVAHKALVDLVAWETDRARDTLQPHQKAFASDPDYKTALGMLRAQRGDTANALGLLSSAAEAAPGDPAPEYYRGDVLSWQKKSDEAQAAWQAAADRAQARLAAKPGDARAAYYRGAALVRLQKPEEARAALQKAAKRGYDPLLTTYQMGLSFFVQGQWVQAQEKFDAVLALDPHFAYAYFYRGLTASKLGRKDQLNADLHQFLDLAPNAPDADNARALLAAFQR